MDYLTVNEYAELKECKGQYIRKLCKEGKIQAEQRPHPQNKKMCYMIPVSSLPENLKAKYYKRLKNSVNLSPELKEPPVLKQHKKTVKKRFEEYTAEERKEIALWCNILGDWQTRRVKYKNKCEFDANFIGECRLKYENHNICISTDILYRKYAAFRENDYDGLIDKRGGWNKGISFMNDDIWKMFTKLYLVSSKPTVSRCYTDVKAWILTQTAEAKRLKEVRIQLLNAEGMEKLIV